MKMLLEPIEKKGTQANGEKKNQAIVCAIVRKIQIQIINKWAAFKKQSACFCVHWAFEACTN